MLKAIFLFPGRLLVKLLVRNKKKSYRSARSRPSGGPGTAVVSLFFWLALAAAALWTSDRAGLLKEALDAGVEAAAQQNVEDPAPPEIAVAADVEASSGAAGEALPSVAGSPTGEEAAAGDNPAAGATPTSVEATTTAAAVENVQVWLVMLHTIPRNARAEAERLKTKYRNLGLSVEIMDTDNFPRLLSGRWIIAQGPFDDRAGAIKASEAYTASTPGLRVVRGL
ncbi:MAG: hypothetical protein LBS31_03345 [Candidatus Adiutrix sp.]|jgi:hypothetical protein|nr:hypothetical protein [Candidatus Adiutrix sp.]